MARSLIVYGPKACGKTRNAPQLMKKHCLQRVVELDGIGADPVICSEGVLYLTYDPEAAASLSKKHEIPKMQFETALHWPLNGRG